MPQDLTARTRRAWHLLSLASALLVAPGSTHADRPLTYAITGARIVAAPGKVIDKGTVVLRDGLIEAVGANVAVPPDAERIEADDGWTVYPACIDAASSVGLAGDQPAAGPPRGGPPPKPLGVPGEFASVHPQDAVLDQIDTSGPGVARHRELGFAIAHVLPAKGVFRGSSAVIALREAPPSELILRDRHGQVIALEISSFMARQYPSSKIGAVAAVRQTFLDARRQGEWRARYADNPSGMARPGFEPATTAVLEVLGSERPVFYVSLAGLDPRRFRGIADEFGVEGLVVAQGLADRAPDLAAARMPVLLPLELPDKPDLDAEDGELETGLEDMQGVLRAPRLPAALDAADVEFAFVTLGMENPREFSENLAAVVEAGLARDAALAALTTTPAKLLGLSRVAGTIEPGKAANLLVVEGELFGEKPTFRHVFVDGHHEEVKGDEVIGDPNAVVDPRGVWAINTVVMGRSAESTWTITGREGDYAGYSESASGGRSNFDSVKLRGNAMTVRSTTSRGELEITVVVSGDTLEGDTTMESPRGSMKMAVEGRRTAGPEDDRS